MTGSRAPASSRPTSPDAPWGSASRTRSHCDRCARARRAWNSPQPRMRRQQPQQLAPGIAGRAVDGGGGDRRRGQHGHVHEYTQMFWMSMQHQQRAPSPYKTFSETNPAGWAVDLRLPLSRRSSPARDRTDLQDAAAGSRLVSRHRPADCLADRHECTALACDLAAADRGTGLAGRSPAEPPAGGVALSCRPDGEPRADRRLGRRRLGDPRSAAGCGRAAEPGGADRARAQGRLPLLPALPLLGGVADLPHRPRPGRARRVRHPRVPARRQPADAGVVASRSWRRSGRPG